MLLSPYRMSEAGNRRMRVHHAFFLSLALACSLLGACGGGPPPAGRGAAERVQPAATPPAAESARAAESPSAAAAEGDSAAVSYTHLTLPTKRIV